MAAAAFRSAASSSSSVSLRAGGFLNAGLLPNLLLLLELAVAGGAGGEGGRSLLFLKRMRNSFMRTQV